MNSLARLSIGLSTLLLLPESALFAQGLLTPPGTPAPTMKTLDQIEARTPIDAIHTAGGSGYQFIVSAAGSYYLTGNLVTSGSNNNCIHVTSADVTIDLNGFQIRQQN